MSELSIIIPTSNSMRGKKNSLQLVLYSIARQQLDKAKIDIIFIDNGSCDDTVDYIQKWITANKDMYYNLQLLINHDAVNRSKSRNMGVAKASAENLLFIDDDTIIYDSNTLNSLLNEYYTKNSFFCGAQRYWTIAQWEHEHIKQHIERQSPIYTFAILPRGINRETGFRDLQEFSFIGNFGGMMKEDFNTVGGFDAIRFPARQEDVDLMYRLLMNGVEFQQLPQKIKVIHLNHPIVGNKDNEKQYWLNEFRKKELEEGFYFCINHLFGVIEDHGNHHPVLKMTSD